MSIYTLANMYHNAKVKKASIEIHNLTQAFMGLVLVLTYKQYKLWNYLSCTMSRGGIQWFCHGRMVWVLAHLFCISVFFVQLIQLLPSYFAPSLTYTEVTNVQLKDIDFPLDIKICVKPILNDTALKKFGYNIPSYYAAGWNNDMTLVGWGGHNNNSGAMATASEVLKGARANVTKDILSKVSFVQYDNRIIRDLLDLVSLDKINWLEECHILNLSRVRKVDLDGMKAAGLYFNQSDLILKNNFTLELKVSGKTLASRRNIMENQFFSSGIDMKLTAEDLKINKYPTFIVKIKKNVFVEEDQTKNCRNYPNIEFSSYGDCDTKKAMKKVKDLSPVMDLIPPWLTDDLTNVTTTPVKLSFDQSYQMGGLFFGIEASDCPLPCTTVSTEAKLVNEYENSEFGFGLGFHQTVEVRMILHDQCISANPAS